MHQLLASSLNNEESPQGTASRAHDQWDHELMINEIKDVVLINWGCSFIYFVNQIDSLIIILFWNEASQSTGMSRLQEEALRQFFQYRALGWSNRQNCCLPLSLDLIFDLEGLHTCSNLDAAQCLRSQPVHCNSTNILCNMFLNAFNMFTSLNFFVRSICNTSSSS